MRDNVLALGGGERVRASCIRTGTRAQEVQRGLRPHAPVRGQRGHAWACSPKSHVKLYPLPEAVSAAICHFADIGSACARHHPDHPDGCADRALRAAGRQRRARGQCTEQARVCASCPCCSWSSTAAKPACSEQAQTVQAIATELGGEAFEWASTPEERTRLWTARHKAYFAGMQHAPGLPHRHHRHLRAHLAAGRDHRSLRAGG
jgi:D-lactate dehydrogenase (cytochrome)